MHFEFETLESALDKCRIYDNKLQENQCTDYLRKIQEIERRNKNPFQKNYLAVQPTQSRPNAFYPNFKNFNPNASQNINGLGNFRPL